MSDASPGYATSTEQVRAWLDAGTLHVCFDNPARHNALSLAMWAAVPSLLAQAEADDRVRLVVFAGAGLKAFASGADISRFEDERAEREAVTRYEATAEAAMAGIQNFPKPTLACIRGWCIGGGLNVAMACDIRIASTDAVFSVPAAKLGLGYRWSAMRNLVDLVGPGVAKDLLFTARRIDAAEARSIGLVSRVAPPDELDALLAEYMKSIGENAPLTMHAGKRVVAGVDRDACERSIRACFDSADYAEGRAAFMQKRRAVFTGR